MHIQRLRGKQLDDLFDAILSLETREECYRFFDDLATANELKSFAQRYEVANMLKKGYTYKAIEKKTNASTATISRVRRSIDYGSDGYKLIIERLSASE